MTLVTGTKLGILGLSAVLLTACVDPARKNDSVRCAHAQARELAYQRMCGASAECNPDFANRDGTRMVLLGKLCGTDGEADARTKQWMQENGVVILVEGKAGRAVVFGDLLGALQTSSVRYRPVFRLYPITASEKSAVGGEYLEDGEIVLTAFPDSIRAASTRAETNNEASR